MSQDRLPPPEPEACLVRLRPSSQKGGTIVVEDVTDLETHELRLCDPDGYRPAFCPNCRGTTLHVHDYRERALRAEPGPPTARVVRHECVGCDAIWQILPAFIVRHLWRSWQVVEHTLLGASSARTGTPGQRWPPIPERTRRRWFARWLRPAEFLVQVLKACGEALWVAVASGLAPASNCADLVAVYAASGPKTPGQQLLAAVAAHIYRLQPRVRLM